MLVTTVTTAGSFYANCMSEVVVVRAFGFFMGTVVMPNWLHVMVIFPSFLLVYEIWWGRVWRKCCCCFHKKKCCVKFCGASNLTMTDEEYDTMRSASTRNLLESVGVEVSDEDTANSIQARHAKEIEERAHLLDEAQKATHSRLQ